MSEKKKKGLSTAEIKSYVLSGVAGLLGLGVFILNCPWVFWYSQEVRVRADYYVEGSCADGITGGCTNENGEIGFGKYTGLVNIPRWFYFLCPMVMVLTVVAGAYAGAPDKPRNVLAIVIGGASLLITFILLFTHFLILIPGHNGENSSYFNPWSDRRWCCVKEFAMKASSGCPNGGTNYQVFAQGSCPPNLQASDLNSNGVLVYLLIAHILSFISGIGIIGAAYFAIPGAIEGVIKDARGTFDPVFQNLFGDLDKDE